MKKLILTLAVAAMFSSAAYAVGPDAAPTIDCKTIAKQAAAKAQAVAGQGAPAADPAAVAPAN